VRPGPGTPRGMLDPDLAALINIPSDLGEEEAAAPPESSGEQAAPLGAHGQGRCL
jgi:hypothetical protein